MPPGFWVFSRQNHQEVIIMTQNDREQYETPEESIEAKLDEADLEAETTSVRLSASEVFGALRNR